MKPIPSVLVTLILCMVVSDNFAQGNSQPNTGAVTAVDFALPKSPVINNNSSAFVLFNIGSLHFEGNKHGGWVSYVFTRHTRIKIMSRKEFDRATFHFMIRGRDERQDLLEDLKATTYNLENGKVVESALSPSDIFENPINKSALEKKFTLPNVKEGSIIDFSYKITSYRYYSIPDWTFQEFGIPVLYSEFELATPDLLRYTIAHHGVDSFFSVSSSESYETMNIGESVKVSSTIHKHKWIMKDIPGFAEVSFLNAQEDFLDKLVFNLVQTYNGEDVWGITEWSAVNDFLMRRKDFGLSIDPDHSENLSGLVDKITANDNNLIDAARNLYTYVRNNFTCIPDNDFTINKDLYDINKARKGSVADLNMLLIAMLLRKGIVATPVLLSTRNYGRHPINYPILDKINYVVCKMKYGGETYYLDATNPQMGFGKLPLYCYNGHARVIGKKDSGDVYFFPDAIKEPRITTVFIQNNEKDTGAMSASVQYNPGYFESTDIRNSINKSGEEAFFKRLKANYWSDMELTNTGIDSLSNLEIPVKIHYDVDMKSVTGADVIYFTPIVAGNYKSNPFASEDRRFPVEMDYPLDRTYVLNMEIPAGYVIDEIPKSAKVAFNENEGFYEYLVQKDESSVQLRCRLKLSRATYAAEEYNSLRDFFAFVVKKESEQIVFKKKK